MASEAAQPPNDLQFLAEAILKVQENLNRLHGEFVDLAEKMNLLATRQTEQQQQRAYDLGRGEALIAMLMTDWALRPSDQQKDLLHQLEEWAKKGHNLPLKCDPPLHQATDGVQSVLSRLRTALRPPVR